MHITIASDGSLGLDQPAEFTAFDVRSTKPDVSFVLEALGDDGASADEADHVFVMVAAVRRLAGSMVDDEWEAGFAKMLSYADSQGWLDESSTAIKAHIENV